MVFNLTPDQEKCLLEFRKILKDEIPVEMYNDTILLTKFLKAREFNIKDAEAMIKKNIRWRKEMQIDTLMTDFKPPEVLEKYMSGQIIGFDKEGYPVRYIQMGNVDSKGIFKSTSRRTFLKYLLLKSEEDITFHVSQSEKLGRPIVQTVNIYDAANVSLAQITHVEGVQNFMRCLKIMQDNYPEIIKKAFVINASSYFTPIWAVLQKCMTTQILNKFSIFGQDGWKEELLKTIDADTLPAFLGGNRTDPDGNPLCLTIINHPTGEPVPEKYHLEKDVKKFSRKPGVKTVKIDRQGKTSESIEIKESSSVINWDFLIKANDIGFGILLETSDGETEEMIPVHKIETENDSCRGMYRCKKQGKYLVVFDNSYSWLHSKEIYYRIWLTNSGENKNEPSCT